MTSPRLEQQYRAAVRWYPPRWRRRFGEAMVGGLLDVADGEGRTTPATGELVDLRLRGVVEWGNGMVPAGVRALVASISTGALAAFSLAYFFFVSWPAGFRDAHITVGLPTFGPFLNAAPLFILPVLAMAVAGLAGARVFGHLVGVVALLAVVSAAVVRTSTGNWNGPGSTTSAFVALMIVAANLGAARHRFIAATSFGVVGVASTLFGVARPPSGQPWEFQFVGDAGWWTMALSPWALAVAGVLVLVGVVVLQALRRDVLAAAVAVAWLPWAAAATVTLRVFAGEEADSFVMAIGSVTLSLFALHRARTRAPAQRAVGPTPTSA